MTVVDIALLVVEQVKRSERVLLPLERVSPTNAITLKLSFCTPGARAGSRSKEQASTYMERDLFNKKWV